MTPTFIPFDDVSINVFSQFPMGTSLPNAGSKTLASNQGKRHCVRRWRNWATPKSRSWFCRGPVSYHTRANSWLTTSTYPNAGHICPRLIQKRHHVPALCDRTLQTGVVGIARKEGQDIGLFGEGGVVSIVIDDGLEPCYAAHRFSGPFPGAWSVTDGWG